MMEKLNLLLPGIKVMDPSSFQLLGAPILNDALTEMLSAGLECMIIQLYEYYAAHYHHQSPIPTPD